MKQTLASAGYLFDEEKQIWKNAAYESIDYSDGNGVEEGIASIINEATDVSVMSAELRKHCVDWPKTYHLHPNRANLLRPIENHLKGDVLEVGCGCGAISRFLGENGATVLALEGSVRRASIARLRTRDLANVTVLSEKFSELKIDKKFDVVTFIGVLEYSRKFTIDEQMDGIDATLELAKSYLKPNGKLVVAIENRLGLKYFAGFNEDHFGQPMIGIEDHYDMNSIVTFGRKELGERLAKIGLVSHEWWYPFPDYKLPNLVVSDAGATPTNHFDVATLVKSASSKDMQYPELVNFMQERALGPVIENDLLPELANSFLLVASPKSDEIQICPLAMHYSVDRRPEFSKKVVFNQAADGSIISDASHLTNVKELKEHSLLKQELSDSAYVVGELLQDQLFDILTKPNWSLQEVQAWFDVWFDAFCNQASINNEADLSHVKVGGEFFDAIPRNLIINQSGLPVFIDQEWVYGEGLEVGYIVFRALLSSFTSVRYVSQPQDDVNLSITHLINVLMKSKSLPLENSCLQRYFLLEAKISELAQGFTPYTGAELSSGYELLAFSVQNTLTQEKSFMKARMAEMQAQAEGEALGHENHLKAQAARYEEHLKAQADEYQRLINSKSWRLTKPLRAIVRLISRINH